MKALFQDVEFVPVKKQFEAINTIFRNQYCHLKYHGALQDIQETFFLNAWQYPAIHIELRLKRLKVYEDFIRRRIGIATIPLTFPPSIFQLSKC